MSYFCHQCDEEFEREESTSKEPGIYCSRGCEETAEEHVRFANEHIRKIMASYPEAFARTITRLSEDLNSGESYNQVDLPAKDEMIALDTILRKMRKE